MKKNPCNLNIAQSIKLKEIEKIALKWGLLKKEIELFGHYKAKISLSAVNRFSEKRKGKYILVTACTPTPLGEGKTSNTIGLSLAINKLGKKSVCCIRQPSLGPLFGTKGGGCGGGYSQVLPMEDFNLHLTGDNHAVSAAHNLLSAFIDNSLYFDNPLSIDSSTITWKRVVDISDRFLRKIKLSLNEPQFERESGFDIAVASEVMSILSLSKNVADLKKRLENIIVASDAAKKPVKAKDLKIAGAMAVLLKDAIKPNLLQTTEHTPCIVHGGCFANVSIGTNSILADYLGLGLSDYCVTESGFGADCGAEKFFDIKCRISGLRPDAAVVICTVRALKIHSGRYKIRDGNLYKEDSIAVREGSCNLKKQIENIKLFGVPVVVAVNKFDTDKESEIEAIKEEALAAGAEAVCVSTVYKDGGRGAIELARAVIKASAEKSRFKFLYSVNESIAAKIEKIAFSVYGAGEVTYSQKAEEAIEQLNKWGLDKLPVCMAKTQLSLSGDPKLKGCPRGFDLNIDRIYPAAGAGFITAICGKINTMPGLPRNPVGHLADLKKDGTVRGLF
ncbi:MAG: formate--tetrahydrofolate ligase [Candidatus Omnitrophota bacterium]